LKGIEVTINGRVFEHLIYHYRLGYSGWQYAQIIQGGESCLPSITLAQLEHQFSPSFCCKIEHQIDGIGSAQS
jgi:hypothetical protein